MNIAITGASGFLGSNIVNRCEAFDVTPIILNRDSSDKKKNAISIKFKSICYDNIDDVKLASKLREYNPQCFINCAWKGVDKIFRNDLDQINYNLPFLLSTIRLAKNAGCKHWIGIGSLSEYGNVNNKVSENHSTEPVSIYAKSKLATCWASSALCQALLIKWSWVRLSSIYGPGDDDKWLIPTVIKSLINGDAPKLTFGEQKWDCLYISDAADAVLQIAKKEVEGVYNLGSGESRSVKEIVLKIRKLIDTSVDPIFGAIPYSNIQNMHLEADIAKISNALDWKPVVLFEEGLKRTIAAIQDTIGI